MNTYLRLLAFIRPYIPRFILAAVCTIGATGANLYVPWIMREVIDKVLADKDIVMLNMIAAGMAVAAAGMALWASL